jgi:hypothetical protein
MLKTRLAKEVVVRIQNEIGALNRITKAIADRGANVLAVSAWVSGDQAMMHLMTDDNVRVIDTLRAHGYEAREADVLVTDAPHKPGMLRRITDRLAGADIDIHHLYSTASVTQDHALVVFATANNDRALVLLNAEPPER